MNIMLYGNRDIPSKLQNKGDDITKKILLTTSYTNNNYDYIAFNSRSKYFKFCWPRIQSYGLRFLKQNISDVEILEYPRWDQYVKKLQEGWDVVGFSFYLNDTPEVMKMVDYARAVGVKEIWSGNYGALTPEIRDRVDKIFIGYAEQELAAEVGKELESIVHPPLVEYLATPFGLKLNWYGILFTTRGCPFGCKFCQTPAFCSRPSAIPIESIERLLSYYRDLGVKVVLIEDEISGYCRGTLTRLYNF
ncbi:MAG: hypothetical protein LUQ47_04865 [Methanotrichaceae archaeon]|nr:hypothetical protein [Methanotrichaceae archaeon]